MPLVAGSNYHDNDFSEESQFSQFYPLSIQQLDQIHWSPLKVTYKAVQFLANKQNVKILDIGSGVGKFCLAGAYYKPSAFFYGVEQRLYLVELAQLVRKRLGSLNTNFIHKSFTQVDFKNYDNFYFYNSFFENLNGTDKIDDTLNYSGGLYNYYNQFLSKKLNELPSGTRIVTYKSLDFEIPPSFYLVDDQINLELKFWMKE